MERIEYRTKDKSEWDDGPWMNEPDKIQWLDEATGLPCLMVRPHGSWCGYVGVPPTHPAYGKHYDNVDVDVHGGLTFASRCMTTPFAQCTAKGDEVVARSLKTAMVWGACAGVFSSLTMADLDDILKQYGDDKEKP